MVRILESLGTGEPGGTAKLREHFCSMAAEWGGTTAASGLTGPKCSPEYLVDTSVWKDTPGADPKDPFGYRGLLLAAEVEWSPDPAERDYDFCKLADVRAQRRIFIGGLSGKHWSEVGGVIARMQGFLDQHEFVGEDEEYGVVLCSYGRDESCGAWVLRRGQKPEVVPTPR